MGKIILVTGGARSGKSTFAEELLKEEPSVCYLATSIVQPGDSEMADRVKKHQKQRSKEWVTEERFKDIGQFLREHHQYKGYLLDCATLLSINYFYSLMTDEYGANYSLIDEKIAGFTEEDKNNIEAKIMVEWHKIIESARHLSGDLIIVSNEVGLGIVPENPFTRWFRDIYGRVNQYLGKESDEVYFVVAGIPMEIKK